MAVTSPENNNDFCAPTKIRRDFPQPVRSREECTNEISQTAGAFNFCATTISSTERRSASDSDSPSNSSENEGSVLIALIKSRLLQPLFWILLADQAVSTAFQRQRSEDRPRC